MSEFRPGHFSRPIQERLDRHLVGGHGALGFFGPRRRGDRDCLIVLFAVLLGFAQEYRSERALEALRQMAAPTATVLRDGEEVVIPARDIVTGDVILLRSGDKVPADARLIEAVTAN